MNSLLQAVEIIYNRLYLINQTSTFDQLNVDQVLRFLSEKDKINPSIDVYRELIINISKLRAKEINPNYIERFCISKIAGYLLTIYPFNIGEAFVVAYVLLNKSVNLHLLHFKLGASGLLAPTLIDGEKIEDVEAIAQFILKSLRDAQIIQIKDNLFVTGLNLKL